MEDRAKFTLENHVSKWMLSISKQGSFTKENLLELESHLLDEIDSLKKKGLSEGEAFVLAKKRIGEVESLSNEFNKVNRTFFFYKNVLPYFKGILGYIALSFSISTLGSLFYYIGKVYSFTGPTHNVTSISLLSSVGVLISLYVYRTFKTKRFGMLYQLISPPITSSIIILNTIVFVLTPFLLRTSEEIANNYYSTGHYYSIVKSNIYIFNLILLGSIAVACLLIKRTNKIKNTSKSDQNNTPFKFNDSIEEWKLDLSKNTPHHSTKNKEQENNLVLEMNRLQSIGFNEEESFLVAKKRISPQNLEINFNKSGNKTFSTIKFIPYLKGALISYAFIKSLHLFQDLSYFLSWKLGLVAYTNTISSSFLITLSLLISGILYMKFKNKPNPLLIKFLSIPGLLLVIVTSIVIKYNMPNMYDLVTPQHYDNPFYSSAIINTGIFMFTCLILISILSVFMNYRLKKANQLVYE